MVTDADSLAHVLFGKTRQGVLGLLYSSPNERFHLRQIERLSGSGIGPVQRELKNLTSAGIVVREREGIHVMYKANASSPVFAEIKALVLKTVGAGEVIRIALAALEREIRAAYLFGSVARGEQHRDSDVDVLLISDTLTLERVLSTLRPAERKIGREINPVIYRLAEFKRKLRDHHPFLTRVMKEKKHLLLGNERELE